MSVDTDLPNQDCIWRQSVLTRARSMLIRVTLSADDATGLQILADHLLTQVDRLCVEQCQRIQRQVDAYRSGGVVSEEDLLREGRAHAMFMLEALGTGNPNTTPARRLGRKRAQARLPLADVMSAYRVGHRFWWETIAQAVDEAGLPRRTLLIAGSQIWQHQAEYTEAMATAYREVATEQLLQRSQARSALVVGLLAGTLPAEISKSEAARILGLPESGHFVVVAISVDALSTGTSAIETALQSVGFPCAWCLEPNTQIGLVSLSAASRLSRLKEVLTRNAGDKIGVGALHEGLPPPSEGLRYARAALLAATKHDRVVVFDQNPYAVAAVSDPEILSQYARTVLGGLSRLSPPDRAALLETFLQWVASGGSLTDTAEVLSCHPNTVRYRLRRIKEYTDRDPARPGDVAELRLAVEAETRLHSD